MAKTTPLIDDGDTQIVLIPAEFRLPGEVVRVRREGDAVVLEPICADEPHRPSLGREDLYIICLGLLVIAGAVWVHFGIGNESWTNWMMAGAGAVLVASRLIHRWRKRAGGS
ncbi:MAG: hypothetical protein Q7U72_09075 [Brevundimonas sp.]|uniref:antitoxin n=1 Tax=Brevundimonas sp. TaxID=1871086 RepID=UPI00271CF935|nr:hypothetical protein [Brevundimonas sp.]MDO9077588.1 hypothetical protein [Brevundimonas sp.]MDP3080589.1 hypothetical protein [Brevundimonas sp.]MDZ4059562.1 hypothetical protein [Brevundimonas sp.]